MRWTIVGKVKHASGSRVVEFCSKYFLGELGYGGLTAQEFSFCWVPVIYQDVVPGGIARLMGGA